MSIADTVDEKAVGVVAIGQLHREGFDAVGPQALGELTGGSLPAAVAIGVESQINDARGTVAQLMNLGGVQASSQRAGDVAKSCLPQDSPVEQARHGYDLGAVTYLFPAIRPTLAAGQKSMRVGFTDAASVEVAVERDDDAMGECIEAFQRDDTSLLQVAEPIAQAHQPGA